MLYLIIIFSIILSYFIFCYKVVYFYTFMLIAVLNLTGNRVNQKLWALVSPGKQRAGHLSHFSSWFLIHQTS